ncbi:DICT sensory domain-containing protein [Halobellus ordinarius]|uniref:DICT sensory domain-containing protein n=1 Tax=Halobellus ordinarius TaxID=3075120 RepID=UPI0028807749|nr:DICT sensory domain-containing protein [Halobellus sp. ZY16]
MGLRRILTFVKTLEKELAFFNINPGDPIVDEVETYFETQNLRVTVRETSSGAPTDLAILSREQSVLAVLAVETLRNLVAGAPPADSAETGIADSEHEAILKHLKETTFTSYDTEQMLYASREIEDRARRVGAGSIHAGFQRCSVMAQQRAVYADLASRGLDVHAYGAPDVPPPDLGGGQVHAAETGELARTWFVVFDGGGDAEQKSALLAEERAEGDFYGVWTYDPNIVDGALDHLRRTYRPPDGDRKQSEN